MLNPFKKKAEMTSSKTCLVNPLEGVRVVNGQYVKDDAFNVNVEHEGSDGFEPSGRSMSPDIISKVYNHERMHRHIVKAMGWYGKKKGYSSLQIDEDDEDFKNACDVLHGLMADSVFAPAFDYLGDEAIEKALIVAVGVGPVATAFWSEYSEKKKAQLVNVNVDEMEGEAND